MTTITTQPTAHGLAGNDPAGTSTSSNTSDLEIRAADQGGFYTAQVACGAINDHTAPEFQDLMLGVVKRANGNVAIAMGGVGTISSAGLSTLVGIARACTELGGKCVLHDVPDDIARIIRTTHLDKVVPIAKSLDDAKKMLSPHRKRGAFARLLGN
ncbi:MAG: STAS domain-containing protein [Planctomycetota bacterium]